MANPTSSYPMWRHLLRLAVKVFFARVEVSGSEYVPEQGGGLVVAWHPNGLIDGLLILTCSPRPVVFGARHGLFKMPLLGGLLRSLGTVPLYRRQDTNGTDSELARRAANHQALEQLSAAATRNFVAIFPEGVTHDASEPQALRSGAARLWLLARRRCQTAALHPAPAPTIVPVGLHYDKKHAFRSRVLVAFHPPIEFAPELANAAPTDPKAVDAITEKIEHTLDDVVHATDTWEVHHLMERARRLVRAERSARAGATLERADMKERDLGFKRVWLAYQTRRDSDPTATKKMMARLSRYSDGLRLLRLNDHQLDLETPARIWRRFPLLAVEGLIVFLLLPPFVLLGYAVSLPTALLLRIGSKRWSRSRKEQAGIKLMVGIIALPLTWLTAGVIVGWARPAIWTTNAWTPQTPVLAALVTIVLCAVGTGLALRYQRLVVEILSGLRTLVVRSRRTNVIARLRARRAALYDELMELSAGLDLPGTLSPEGVVLAEEPRSE